MKIPLHVISGFLGSGKTTLLQNIIDCHSDRHRLGIIQNEFAPASVDGIELKSRDKDFHLLEVNNGSVFCVCLLGDFIHSLNMFIDEYHPDALIVEASGLSDPTSIAEMIAAGPLSEKIYIATHWSIVDALFFKKIQAMNLRIVHQLRMADIIVLNKIDTVENYEETIDEIKSINPFASIYPVSYCQIETSIGDTSVSKFYRQGVIPLGRPDINSMVIRSGRSITRESLMQFLKLWTPLAYRIKGFARLTDGTTLAVQCVFDSVEVRDAAGINHSTELIALSDRFSMREWSRSFKKFEVG